MKNLLDKYRGIRIRDKIIAFALISLLVGATVWASNLSINPLVAMGVTVAILAISDVMIKKFAQVSVAMVILVHLVISVLVSMVYASYNLFTYSSASLSLAFVYVMLTTMVLTLAAVKWSIGRLWVTLLFTYTAIDIGGIALMNLFGNASLFFIPLAGIIALAPRCVHWRTVLRRQTPMTFSMDAKSLKKSQDYLREVLATKNPTVSIYDVQDSDFGLVAYENSDNVWYLHPVHSQKATQVQGNEIIVNNRDYAPMLYAMRHESEKAHKANKKRKKNLHTAVVLVNAKNDQGIDLRVAPKGYQRNKKLVSIVSTINLLKRIQDSQ